jgi:hypothetical protein
MVASFHELITLLSRKTAIEKSLSFVRTAGKEILIFTADQQLYKMAIYIPVLFHSLLISSQ